MLCNDSLPGDALNYSKTEAIKEAISSNNFIVNPSSIADKIIDSLKEKLLGERNAA